MTTYKSFTLKEKLAAITDIEKGKKLKEVSQIYGIKISTLSTIYKNKANLKKQLNQNPAQLNKKRLRVGKYSEIDDAIVNFISDAKRRHIPINSKIIRNKAKEIGESLNVSTFTASNGWLDRLKKRAGLHREFLTKDANEVDCKSVNQWIETVFNPLMQYYEMSNIFNANVTDLNYKFVPFLFKGDNCQKGKFNQERITVMLCCNMSGTEKLRPLVIGKSKQPHCFKNVLSLPVEYDSNKKAEINSDIFEKWLLNLDEMFTQQNRKVAFIFDDCDVYKPNISLTSIKLEHFPSNIAQTFRPMTINKCLKIHYCNDVILSMLESIKKFQEIKQITILDCIRKISKIWDVNISSDIIKSCFKRYCIVDNEHCDEDQSTKLVCDEARHNYEQLKYIVEIEDDFDNFLNLNLLYESFVTTDQIDDTNNLDNKSVTKEEIKDAIKVLYRGLIQLPPNVSPDIYTAIKQISDHFDVNF